MRRIFHIVFYFLTLITPQSVHGQIKLPRLVRDSMVLQRDANIKIWGWAAKDEKITLKFNDKSYKTKATSTAEARLPYPA